MSERKRSNLTGLLLPLGVAILVVGGYYFYWRSVADRIETSIRAALPEAALSSIKVTGFPYRLTAELSDVAIKVSEGSTLFATRLDATATPINPLLWVLEGASGSQLRLANGTTTNLTPKALQASLRFARTGSNQTGLERFSLTFDGLEATDARSNDKAWSVGAGQVHLVRDPAKPDVIAARFDLSNFDLAAPLDGPAAILGQRINKFMLAGPINKSDAFLRSGSDWARAGGQMNVMAGEIMWGPVSLTEASGEIRQSDAGKWQGQIRGKGALKPEGLSVDGLTAPVSVDIVDNRPALSGLPGLDLGGAFAFGRE
jgi:hypothetical protein